MIAFKVERQESRVIVIVRVVHPKAVGPEHRVRGRLSAIPVVVSTRTFELILTPTVEAVNQAPRQLTSIRRRWAYWF